VDDPHCETISKLFSIFKLTVFSFDVLSGQYIACFERESGAELIKVRGHSPNIDEQHPTLSEGDAERVRQAVLRLADLVRRIPELPIQSNGEDVATAHPEDVSRFENATAVLVVFDHAFGYLRVCDSLKAIYGCVHVNSVMVSELSAVF